MVPMPQDVSIRRFLSSSKNEAGAAVSQWWFVGQYEIVSAQWIEESTRQHSSWGDLMYGYLWWVINEKERSYAAMGDGGNALYVNT